MKSEGILRLVLLQYWLPCQIIQNEKINVCIDKYIVPCWGKLKKIILMDNLFYLFLTHLQFGPRTFFWFRHACALVFRKMSFLIYFIFTFLAGIIFRPFCTSFCSYYMFCNYLSRKKSPFSC